jgi:AraC-like DNA-binding protein
MPDSGTVIVFKILGVLANARHGGHALVVDEIAAALCLGKPRVEQYLTVLQRGGRRPSRDRTFRRCQLQPDPVWAGAPDAQRDQLTTAIAVNSVSFTISRSWKPGSLAAHPSCGDFRVELSPWLEGRNHIHPAIHRAQDAVAATPAQNWSVAALAKIAGTSPRNLSRLFSAHTGISVTDYVNRIRIALARELVTGSRLDMENVAQRAGFTSARQFRRAWKRLHDTPPAQQRGASGWLREGYQDHDG